MFADYALFAPINKISNLSDHNAFSGASPQLMQQFDQKYQKFDQYIEKNKFTEQQEMENFNKLKFSSHYENMHSIFLHFISDLILTLMNLAFEFLEQSEIDQGRFIIALIGFIITIFLCKSLLVTTTKLLLLGLPVDDDKTINSLLRDLMSIEGIISIEKKHFWALSTGYLVCNISLKIRKEFKEESIQQQAENIIQQKFQSSCIEVFKEY